MSRTVRLNDGLVLAAMWALMTAAPLAFAQEPGTCPDAGGLFAAYDVVSVKPSHPDRIINTAVFHYRDGIGGDSVTVEMIVRSSYAYTFGTGNAQFVNEDVISGLPDWAKTDTFALQAKMSPEQMAVFAKLDQGQQRACQDNMEQAIVADRFKLKMHRQPREVPAYDLVVAKGGSKLKKSSGPQTGSLTTRPSGNAGEVVIQAHSTSMQELAVFVVWVGINHSVRDKTGLMGRYNFTLTFTPSQGMGPVSDRPTDTTVPDPQPSIFTALEDQVGLRLQRTTMTLDTVVVDHVERPTAN